jgi:UDP-glucuronate 4-epimerase
MIKMLEKDLQEKPPGYFDIVNIGGGNPVSMNDLMEIVSKCIGKPLEFKKGEANPKDVKQTMANAEYLVSLVKAKPSTPIHEGIVKTIKWANSITPGLLSNWVQSSK